LNITKLEVFGFQTFSLINRDFNRDITNRCYSLFDNRAIIFICLCFAVCAPLELAANSLAEYKENIRRSRKSIIKLQNPSSEDVANKYYPEF